MFTTIPSSLIAIGKSLKKELFDIIKTDLDDLDTRMLAVEGIQPLIEIFNDDVVNASSASALYGLAFYKAQKNMRLIKGEVQLFALNGSLSGNLVIDFKVGDDPGTMNSVFSVMPSIDLSTASDYQTAEGVFNPAFYDVNANQFIRFDINSLPTSGILGRFRIVLYGVAL